MAFASSFRHCRGVITYFTSSGSFSSPSHDAPGPRSSVADYLANVTKKRNVVFVISDFLDVDFEAPLRALGHKHDVIALILNDPRELELPSVGLVALEDAESGRVGYVDTADPAVRERFARAARERRAQRLRTFSRMGVDRVDLSTDRPYVPALLALFNARSRRN